MSLCNCTLVLVLLLIPSLTSLLSHSLLSPPSPLLFLSSLYLSLFIYLSFLSLCSLNQSLFIYLSLSLSSLFFFNFLFYISFLFNIIEVITLLIDFREPHMEKDIVKDRNTCTGINFNEYDFDGDARFLEAREEMHTVFF